MAMDRGEPLDMARIYEIEAANVALVKSFLASWREPLKIDYGPLAPDGLFRSNDWTPTPKNAAELREYFQTVVTPEDRVEVAIHQIFAKGTLVAMARTDTVKAPGKRDRIYEIAAHFTVRNGKIAEWTDHVYSWRVAE
jgi:limonene-1,2-epoxide hydrolase